MTLMTWGPWLGPQQELEELHNQIVAALDKLVTAVSRVWRNWCGSLRALGEGGENVGVEHDRMMESLMMGYIIDFSDILGVSMMLFF